ncbi:MAG: response regulator [Spirochaetia bacterium]|nr:response regulator [Spirochaetia bacterium]
MPDAKMISKILLVDDEEKNIKLMKAVLESPTCLIQVAANGQQCLDQVAKDPPDLIILDLLMPVLSGFEATRILKGDPKTKMIPIMIISSMDDQKSRIQALEFGAEDFLLKPISQIEVHKRVRNILRLKEYSNFLAGHNAILEEQVAERTLELRTSYIETILTLTRAAERRDEDTGGHIQRISFYCKALAEKMGLDQEFCLNIFHASPMHDIGKISIPDSILCKGGALTPEEWVVMKTHPEIGAEILKDAQSPYLRMGQEVALAHHEKWDGSGYPFKLKGEKIPLSARIMTIADQYDALRSKRPYKLGFTHEHTASILLKGDDRTKPSHFDPAVLSAFDKAHKVFEDIYHGFLDKAYAPKKRSWELGV